MKTLTLMCASALLPVALCHGQAAAVYDTVNDSRLQTLHSDFNTLNTVTGKILSDADQQLQKLKDIADSQDTVTKAINNVSDKIDKITDVVGDPSKVDKGGFNKLHSSVQKWIDDGKLPDPPKFDDVDNPTSKNDGNKAFTLTADNLFDAIGSQFDADPSKTAGSGTNWVDSKHASDPTNHPNTKAYRDPKLYTSYVDELASVSQYFSVRDAAIKRRNDLQTLLRDTLDAIRDADDFATVQKLSTLAGAVQSQLQAVNDDINTAFNDVAARGVQMFAMGQIQQTASNEVTNAAMADKVNKANSAATTSTPASGPGSPNTSATITSVGSTAILPWHRAKF